MSQENHQYNVNTAQQYNMGHIPKALCYQLPPCVKSTISNSDHHHKQQANSTTAHSNDVEKLLKQSLLPFSSPRRLVYM